MNEQAINELEAAAQIIMAPPNIVSSEQRHAAESVFLNFRKTKSPYGVCREILEKSQNQYVMFEAAEVMKEAIIREWSFLLESDRTSLRQYLMQYISSHEVPHFVRDRILQVIAIMVKRSSIDDGGKERGIILQEVENLIVNAEADKKLLGCAIISNLMQEYATTIKSTDVGLPWEVHFKAKKQFEATDLKRIFQFCIYLLSEVVKNDPPYNDIMVQLTRHLLQITEKVLTWGYVSPILPKRLIGIYEYFYESDQAPALKLTSSWSEIIFNPDLIPMMFQIYWKVRDIDELAHHSLSCLVQLASLSGGIVNNDEMRLKYLHLYLVTFFNLISNVTIRNKESLGISNICRKLVTFYIHDFNKLPAPIQDTLLDEYTRLTCHFCEGASHEDVDPETERFYMDAFDNMLEAWTTMLQEFGNSLDENQKSCAIRIFNKYVQCHLAPPDGSRIPEGGGGGNLDEEAEDNDRQRYKEQLQIVGMFGRCILSHALPVIYKILELRIEAFMSHLQVMRHRAININEAATLENLFEDIHWAILIAGHVVCMESEGETALIPSEIITYATTQESSGVSNLEATIKTLAAADPKEGRPTTIDQCDEVLRITFNVLRLCSLEDHAASMKLGQFLSPEVGSTLMWFLRRWSLTYLMPTESYYQEMSPIYRSSLGKATAGAKMVAGFILAKINNNLCNFCTEPILLRDTVSLLNDLVCTRQKSIHIVKTEEMLRLIKMVENSQPGTYPPNILRDIYKGLTTAGNSLMDLDNSNDESIHFYESILNPLKSRFTHLLRQANFSKICQEEQIQKILTDILECFVGVAKGCQMASVELLFEFMLPILSEMAALITLYKDFQVIVQLILELFGQCAKYMLCYLKHSDSTKFYETSLAAVQAYAKCNSNRLSNETFAEESSCQDLALVLDLLTFILSKDCIDLCTVPPKPEEVSVTASDVSLFGLNFIMPLMTLELLKFPSLCAQYYRLLVLINDIYPEKIAGLPHNMLSTLLKSIEIGLTNFGSDIVQACLDFVQGMASYVFRHHTFDSPFAMALKPFLKLLMDLTLSHQINSDMFNSASTTIYSLICCYQEEYQLLVQSLLQMQSDPMTVERLAAAFNNLTQNVPLNCERQPKIKFRENFEKFIANVHGFLLVK